MCKLWKTIEANFHRSEFPSDDLNYYAYVGKGDNALENGDVLEALASYRLAQNVNNANPFIHSTIADVLRRLGRYSEAIEAVNYVIELMPDVSNPYAHKASIYMETSDYDLALRACEEALTREPENFLWWKNKGMALVSLGAFEDAYQAYTNAIVYGNGYESINILYEERAAIQEEIAKKWQEGAKKDREAAKRFRSFQNNNR